MIVIKNKTELDKFKKEIDNNIIYQFEEDVVFDFKQVNMQKKFDKIKEKRLKECKTNYEKVMLAVENKLRPRVVYKGKSMTFNQDVDWIDKLELEGNLICKERVEGGLFYIHGSVEAKWLACERLDCASLTGSYISAVDLFCKGDINCEMLKTDHIISCEKLKADILTFGGSMLYKVTAIGENLNIK